MSVEAKNAFAHAKNVAPRLVNSETKARHDVVIGFFGKPSSSAANQVLSFQGSLERELNIQTKLTKIEAGCFECYFQLGRATEAKRLAMLIDVGQFDSLAYRYRILFVKFLTSTKLDEYYFERDSLYR